MTIAVSDQIGALRSYVQSCSKNPKPMDLSHIQLEIERIQKIADGVNLEALVQLSNDFEALKQAQVEPLKESLIPRHTISIQELRRRYEGLVQKAQRGVLDLRELLNFQDLIRQASPSFQTEKDFKLITEGIEALITTTIESKSSSARTSLSFLFEPIRSFVFGEHEYVVRSTRAQGSCALDALLGEEIKGVYRFAGDDTTSSARVKKHYTDTLESKLDNPIIQKLFIDVMRAYLNESLKPIERDKGDRSAHMLFSSTQEGNNLKMAWRLLQNSYRSEIERFKREEALLWKPLVEANQEGILDAILAEISEDQSRGAGQYIGMENGQIIELLLREPERISDIISRKREVFLEMLNCPDSSSRIITTHTALKDVLSRLEHNEARVILHSRMFANYVTTVNKPAFYLNTSEINLAAYLFDKKVQIVASSVGEGIVPSEFLMNEDAPGDTIVIHHQGAHFSRCVRKDSIPATVEQPQPTRDSPQTRRETSQANKRAQPTSVVARPFSRTPYVTSLPPLKIEDEIQALIEEGRRLRSKENVSQRDIEAFQRRYDALKRRADKKYAPVFARLASFIAKQKQNVLEIEAQKDIKKDLHKEGVEPILEEENAPPKVQQDEKENAQPDTSAQANSSPWEVVASAASSISTYALGAFNYGLSYLPIKT